MKNTTYKLLAIGFALMAFIAVASAQTNTVPSFFGSAQLWLTSFNPDYNYSNVTFEASTGYKQQVGINAASYVDMQYDIGRTHIGGSFQFAGVGSAVNQEEAVIGYDIIDHYDTRVEANLGAGYNDWSRAGVVEPEIDIKKKLSPNTFAELGMSFPQFLKGAINTSPSFKGGAGFTF